MVLGVRPERVTAVEVAVEADSIYMVTISGIDSRRTLIVWVLSSVILRYWLSVIAKWVPVSSMVPGILGASNAGSASGVGEGEGSSVWALVG